MFVINASSEVLLAACKRIISLTLCVCGIFWIKLPFGRRQVCLGLACGDQLGIFAGQTSIIGDPSRTCLECWSLQGSVSSVDGNHN